MAKTTDLMATSITNDVWLRGCEYVFEHYVNNGVGVYCFGKNGRLLWDGCVQWSEGDRIIDVIRAARYSWELTFPVV